MNIICICICINKPSVLYVGRRQTVSPEKRCHNIIPDQPKN